MRRKDMNGKIIKKRVAGPRFCQSLLTGPVFAMPTFESGLARLWDLAGTFDLYGFEALSPGQVDTASLHQDWCFVGHDLRWAMSKVQEDLSAE